eukprot:scaffold11223_cov57-Attheya_sp.AAC.1
MASDDEQTTVVEHNVLELSPALMGQVRFPPGCSVLYQSPENDGSLTLMGTVVSPCMEVDGHTLRQTHKRVSIWYRVQFNIRSSSSSSQEERMIPEAHLQYARKCPVWVQPQQTQTQTQEWLEGTILASFQTEADDTSPSFSETEPNVLALATAAVDTCYVVKLDGKEGRVGDITNNVTHDALRYRPPTTTTSCPSTPQRTALITTSTTPTISAPTTPARTSNQTLTPPRPLSTIPKQSLPMPIALPVTVTSTHTMNDNTPTKAAHGSDMETKTADDSTMSGSSGSIGVTNHHMDGGNATTMTTTSITTSSPTPTIVRTRIEYPQWLNLQHVHKAIASEGRLDGMSFRLEPTLHSILIGGLSEEDERTRAESLWNHLVHSMRNDPYKQQVLRSELILWIHGRIEPLKLYGHENNSNDNNIRHSMSTIPPLMSPPSKRQKPDTPLSSQPSPGLFTYTSLLTTMDANKPNMPHHGHYHDDKELERPQFHNDMEPTPNMPPRGHYHDDKERERPPFLTASSSSRHAREDHISTSNSDTLQSHADKDRNALFHHQAVSLRSEMERYNSPPRSIDDIQRNHVNDPQRMLFLPPWLNVAIITDGMIGRGGGIHKHLCCKYHCFIQFMKATDHGVGALKVCNSDEVSIRQAMKELINIILKHLNEREQTRFIYETAWVGESIPSSKWHRTVWENGDVPILQRCPEEGMKLMWMGHACLIKEGNPGGILIGKYDRETVTNAIKMVNAKVKGFRR